MSWFVYLARCADDSLYTGVTTDPARRERAHNQGLGAAYTRSRRPVRLGPPEPAAGAAGPPGAGPRPGDGASARAGDQADDTGRERGVAGTQRRRGAGE